MRPLWKDILLALVLGLVLPGALLHVAVAKERRAPEETEPAVTERCPQAFVTLGREGTLTELELESYLTGVVLAEMPASFPPEALKAQAVAARTYTQKAVSTGGKHGDGRLCSDSGCCQAYVEPEDYLAGGGAETDLEKVRGCVAETAGLVLTYGGQLIEAAYFSCSGGTTEAAVAVWGGEFPYLQSVDSPGEEDSRHFCRAIVYPAEEFSAALGLPLPEDPREWFGEITYTEGGGVAAMVIGGETFSGTELRALLNLPSTAFSACPGKDSVTLLCRGYGHRVGMSQYGAKAMAEGGASWRQILAHYYPGTLVETLC